MVNDNFCGTFQHRHGTWPKHYTIHPSINQSINQHLYVRHEITTNGVSNRSSRASKVWHWPGKTPTLEQIHTPKGAHLPVISWGEKETQKILAKAHWHVYNWSQNLNRWPFNHLTIRIVNTKGIRKLAETSGGAAAREGVREEDALWTNRIVLVSSVYFGSSYLSPSPLCVRACVYAKKYSDSPILHCNCDIQTQVCWEALSDSDCLLKVAEFYWTLLHFLYVAASRLQ